VQALCQKLAATVATAVELRQREVSELGHVQTHYPDHPKVYQTVVWKDQALTVLPSGEVRLPCGGQRPPLLLPLPEDCRQANLRRAELTWRAEHFERCLTLDTGGSVAPPLPTGEVAGIDLGEVHLAAMTTTKRHALVVSGRQVRASKQGRANRLLKRQAQVSAKRYGRRTRHPNRRQPGTYQQPEEQPVATWAVRQVSQREGGAAEDGGRADRRELFHQNLSCEWARPALLAARGRRLRCSGCGARVHQDVNGSAKICSKATHGVYSKVQADTVT
jgi:hypothetical protein